MEWLIWDLDGTLLDTLKDLSSAMNQALSRHNLPPHEVDDYRQLVGNGLKCLIEKALPKGVDQETLAGKLAEDFGSIYAKCCYSCTQPYEGIREALETFAALKLPMAVLSNKPDPFAKEMTEHFFPGTFNAILGQREGIPKKPSKEGICALARELNRNPETAIMIGDSDVDILTAKAAGCVSIGCCWGFRGAEELRSAGADFLAETPLQLPEILDKILSKPVVSNIT